MRQMEEEKTETEPALLDHDDVWRWRLDEFRRLGFNLRQRRVLADASVSPHDAERLISAGCPTEIAFDILS